jgi:hypothetical protein
VTAPFSKVGDNTIVFSVSNLSDGIYIVRITDTGGRAYQQKVSVIK